jgi:hypothetical protein
MSVYFIPIWNIITAIRYSLWSFGNFVVIWFFTPRFGALCQEKSGNPAQVAHGLRPAAA